MIDGYCCECDTIGNPYAYWGFTAQPMFSSLIINTQFESLKLTQAPYGYIYNPVIDYYDADNGNIFDADKNFEFECNLVKLKSQAINHQDNINNSSKFSSIKDWKYKCFSEMSDSGMAQEKNVTAVNLKSSNISNWNSKDSRRVGPEYIRSVYTNGNVPSSSVNNYYYNKPIFPYRTWACYHDDEQKYIVFSGTSPRPTKPYSVYNDSYPYSFEQAFAYTFYNVVDIESQNLLYENAIYSTSHKNLPGDGTPIIFGPAENFVSRSNLTVNPWCGIFSTYDDKGNDAALGEYICRRFPIDTSSDLNYVGGWARDVPNNKYRVIRGAYNSYTYGENPQKAPWVIAQRISDNTWVTGMWANNQILERDLGDGETEYYSIPELLETEVINTLNSGILTNNALLLCYNRVKTRELAIWIDTTDRSTSWSDYLGGERPSVEDAFGTVYYAESFYINRIFMYDSESDPQMFLAEEKFWPVWPEAAAQYTPPDCNPIDMGPAQNYDEDCDCFSEPPGTFKSNAYLNSGFLQPPPSRTWYKNFKLSSLNLSVPCFITCDNEDYIYIGNQEWVAKIGKKLKLPTKIGFSNSEWLVEFKNFYNNIDVSVPDGCLSVGGVSTAPEPFVFNYSQGQKGFNYGYINSREFAILPTKKNIHIRGAQGVPEMATNKNLFKKYDYYRDIDGIGHAAKPHRATWLTDWIFSFDSQQRVACVESASVSPRFLVDQKDFSKDPTEGPNSWDPSIGFNGIPPSFKFKNYYLTSPASADLKQTFNSYDRSLRYDNKKYLISRRYSDQNLYDFFSIYADLLDARYIMPFWIPFEPISGAFFKNTFTTDKKHDVSKHAFGLDGDYYGEYFIYAGWNMRLPWEFHSTAAQNSRSTYGAEGDVFLGGELPGGVYGESSMDETSIYGWWCVYTHDYGFTVDHVHNIYKGNLLAVVDTD